MEVFNRQGTEKEIYEFKKLLKQVKKGDENITLNDFISTSPQSYTRPVYSLVESVPRSSAQVSHLVG